MYFPVHCVDVTDMSPHYNLPHHEDILPTSHTRSRASHPLPSARQHQSYGDCLEVKREDYQNCSVLDCVTQCSQSAAHLHEQFLQVK